MTLENVLVALGVTADAAPTKTNIVNSVAVGQPRSQQRFTDADIAYSFKVTADAVDDLATLTLSTGAVVQTNGTPTLTDTGEDFEGGSLPTMVTLYAILVEMTVVGTVNVAGTQGADEKLRGSLEGVGDELRIVHPGGTTNLGTLTLEFTEGTGEVVVTVFGKSS